MAVVENPGTPLGQVAPDFELPDTDGNLVKLSGTGANAVVVYFTCNHCPYAIGWHQRMLDVAVDYEPRGVRIIAINSNDSSKYPADSYAAMQRRLELEGPWPNHPYLFDEDQSIARAYDAKTTPDVFLLDRQLKIRYRGAPDADYRDETLSADVLRTAIDQLLAGKNISTPETAPVGCSIKWKL